VKKVAVLLSENLCLLLNANSLGCNAISAFLASNQEIANINDIFSRLLTLPKTKNSDDKTIVKNCENQSTQT